MIRVALLVTGFLCLSVNLSIGQKLKPSELVKDQVNFKSFEILTLDDKRSVSVPSELHDYAVLSIQQSALKQIADESVDYLELSIPTSRKPMQLRLAKVDINVDGDYVITQPAQKLIKVNPGVHYRGIVRGDEKSFVALSIYQDEVMGLISSDKIGNKVLGKLKASDRHVLYDDANIANLHSLECNTKDHGIQYRAEELKSHSHHHGKRSLNDCVRLYLEVDYDIYQKKGGLEQTVNHITGLYNQIATLYANENIKTSLQPLNVWTQPSPYNATKSVDMLTKFGQTRTTFDGDLAMLLSYKASGGIAYVNALCNNVPRYRMGYAGINENYNNVPTYSWSVMVVTHELGHLMGSQHTHACVWNGNNTAIDGCSKVEGGCGNPGLPTDGGTIMSYCHLTSAGIKFSNGFGTQPGNLIRNRIANATCTTACADNNDGTASGDTSCSHTEVTLELKFDNYPAETSWKLLNSDGETVDAGASYTSKNGTITKKFCLAGGCYQFTITDSYGDGICCSYGIGSYKLIKGSEVLANGGQFNYNETTSFCIDTTEKKPTCDDGIQNGEETDVDCGGPSCKPCKKGCTQNEYTLDLKFDNYPRETSWKILTTSGDELAKGGNYTTANGSASEKLCLPKGCFDFVITDTYGDGICCSYGNGSFTLKDSNGKVVFTGSKFTKSTTERFCVDGTVDGGDDNDTPTCDDGIQNGDETGIDCGGSCQPCNTDGDGDDSGDNNATLLAGHYFESGWDGWIDGGSDCYRYNGPQVAKEGTYSIRLRDNSGVGSSMTSADFDLSSYNSVEVRFYFYPYSMEVGENFFLKFYNGNSWQTISNFVSGTHFQNNQFHEGVVTITNNAFPTNARFRFQCDASNNGDQIYIDAVRITASTTSNISENKSEVQAIGIPTALTFEEESLQVTPNPTMENLYVKITADAAYSTVIAVTDLLGRKLMQQETQIGPGANNIQVETQMLQQGTYLLHMRDEEGEIHIEKFIKM